MKELAAGSLIAFLIVFPCYLNAKEQKGAELIIQIIGGQQAKGELIAIKRDALLLLNPEGSDVAVDIDDISSINIVKKSEVLKGAGYGGLIGAGVGALTGVLFKNQLLEHDTGYETAVIFIGGLGAGIGLLIGGVMGSEAGKDETFVITGMTETDKREIMEMLRKKSRVPDYQ